MAGNWKMYKTRADTVAYLREFMPLVPDVATATSCSARRSPPRDGARRERRRNVAVGAQTMAAADEGAFTGEVSPEMLRELGVPYVILGHSERRQYYGENDADLAKKVRAALDMGLRPILCCGETLEEREAGQTEAKVRGQVSAGWPRSAWPRRRWSPSRTSRSGRSDGQDGHARGGPGDRRLRADSLRDAFEDAANAVRILYGGSVKRAHRRVDGPAGHRRRPGGRRQPRSAGVRAYRALS